MSGSPSPAPPYTSDGGGCPLLCVWGSQEHGSGLLGLFEHDDLHSLLGVGRLSAESQASQAASSSGGAAATQQLVEHLLRARREQPSQHGMAPGPPPPPQQQQQQQQPQQQEQACQVVAVQSVQPLDPDCAAAPGSLPGSTGGDVQAGSCAGGLQGRCSSVPWLDLTRVKPGSSSGVRNLAAGELALSSAAACKEAELCFEQPSNVQRLRLHPNAPLQDSRCYVYRSIGPKELATVQDLLSRLPGREAGEVQALWDALLVARHDCELMAARGVRVSRDISRDWQETVSDLIDRVVSQDAELAQLRQQLKSMQAAGGGTAGNVEELHSQLVRLKRHRDRLTRDQQELSRVLSETQAALADAQQEAAAARDQVAALNRTGQALREQHACLLHQHLELAAYTESLEAAAAMQVQHAFPRRASPVAGTAALAAAAVRGGGTVSGRRSPLGGGSDGSGSQWADAWPHQAWEHGPGAATGAHTATSRRLQSSGLALGLVKRAGPSGRASPCPLPGASSPGSRLTGEQAPSACSGGFRSPLAFDGPLSPSVLAGETADASSAPCSSRLAAAWCLPASAAAAAAAATAAATTAAAANGQLLGVGSKLGAAAGKAGASTPAAASRKHSDDTPGGMAGGPDTMRDRLAGHGACSSREVDQLTPTAGSAPPAGPAGKPAALHLGGAAAGPSPVVPGWRANGWHSGLEAATQQQAGLAFR